MPWYIKFNEPLAGLRNSNFTRFGLLPLYSAWSGGRQTVRIGGAPRNEGLTAGRRGEALQLRTRL
jgi:hypothetical protein